jgi:C4-dicarboxylate-specific signal transduction histidine kinase
MTETNRPSASDSSRKGIAFFGRIMANVSHEFNNIITVISELAGLLKDLSLMAQKGREVPTEKIAAIADGIAKQVSRGKNLITHMNRFSHSADEPLAAVDLGHAIENMNVLTERLFKCKQSEVSYRRPEQDCSLVTDPFELRYIVFSCMSSFLEASAPDVSLSLRRLEQSREWECTLAGRMGNNALDAASRIEELREHAAKLGGRILLEQEEDRTVIRLFLPAGSMPSDPD